MEHILFAHLHISKCRHLDMRSPYMKSFFRGFSQETNCCHSYNKYYFDGLLVGYTLYNFFVSILNSINQVIIDFYYQIMICTISDFF